MNSSGATQSSGQGACGGQVEEDEESSSSSSSLTGSVEDELESFRQKWKQDIQAGESGNGNFRSLGTSSRDDNETGVKKNRNFVNLSSTEERARSFFLEGVEHEQNGELFEAIQKYRKAMALVPDIEFKAFEHNLRRRVTVPKDSEQQDDPASDEDIEDLIIDETPTEEVEDDLLVKFSRLKFKSHTMCEPEVVSAPVHICRLP